MKITLNEKLFEASENKKKEADKKKASSTKPKDSESSVDNESESISDADSGSDYAKKLILLFKKTGEVDPDILYKRSSSSGIETISFTTKKDFRNYTVKLKNTKLEDESGNVTVNKNFFMFYKEIDGEQKAMSGKFLEVEDFEDFAGSVVSYTILDDALKMSKLIPEVEKEVDSGVSSKQSATPEKNIDKAFSGLPSTPEEGKPLPKEISEPPKKQDEPLKDDKELSSVFQDFLKNVKEQPEITVDSENPRENTIFFSNGAQKNRVRFEKTKDGKVVAKYGDRKSPTTTEIENGDFSEVLSNIGINKKSESKPKEIPQQQTSAPAFDAKSEFAKMFGADKNRKKVEPASKPTTPTVATNDTKKSSNDVATQQTKKPNVVSANPSANAVVNKAPEKSKEIPAPPKKVEAPKAVATPSIPTPPAEIVEPKKPVASAVQTADASVNNDKPEIPNEVPSEPSKVEPEINNKIDSGTPVASAEPNVEKPIETPENIPSPVVNKPVSKAPNEKDIKDQISGKDPYVTDRAKQNKNKLSNISNTDFDKFLSEPISLGKKDRVDQKTNLYSRTVYLNKDKVQHIFNLNFIEANKTLFEAVETSLLQQVIKKIVNSLLTMKTKEVAITDFENAELDGLYVPGDMLASVYVKTEKNPAAIPIQKIPSKISSSQISEVAVQISRKLEEIASKAVGTQDTIVKISFLTTLVKSERQPEPDLSGNTNIRRKVKPPAAAPLSVNPNVAVDDYKIDPNNSGVQRMAKQLGISGGDTVPNNVQGIPESQVYKTKAVFELYSPVMAESDLTTDKISASPSFKIRDTKFRGLVNNAFYLEESNSLIFNLMPSQAKGFEVVVSKDSAFVLTANNGERKYFSAQNGYKILAKDKTGKLIPVSDIHNAGMLYYVVVNSLPVVLESNFVPPNDPEQENKKEEVVSKTVPNNKSIPSAATAVGKQKAIQPDTSPISTDPTQIAQIPNQPKPVEPPKQKVNTIDTMSALLQFRRAVLGHIQKNLNPFLELYPKSGKALEKWLIDSGLVQSRTPPTQQNQPNAPVSTPIEPTKPPEKKRGRPPKKDVNQITEAIQPKIWRRPPEKNWQNPNDNPLSVRSTNLRKQDYFGPGQNRKLEKDTIMFATKEQDIIDGVNDVFKHFIDKSLTKQPDLTPYIEKLQNRKFFPIKVEKLQDNIFFVKSDSSDKLFLIAPVGILYERVKNLYQTKSSTRDSRVLKYTKLASIPVERANSSMSVVENQIEKGICVVSNDEYRK